MTKDKTNAEVIVNINKQILITNYAAANIGDISGLKDEPPFNEFEEFTSKTDVDCVIWLSRSLHEVWFGKTVEPEEVEMALRASTKEIQWQENPCGETGKRWMDSNQLLDGCATTLGSKEDAQALVAKAIKGHEEETSNLYYCGPIRGGVKWSFKEKGEK